jgi:hypothetical protein
MMDRRMFFQRSGAAAAAACIPAILAESAKATPLNFNTAPYHQAATYHAICTAHQFAGVPTAVDYFNVANALSQLRVEWLATGLDQVLQPIYRHMTPYMISPQFMNIPLMANAIRTYNPGVTNALVTATLNGILTTPTATTAVLQYLQTPGHRMSDFLEWDINAAIAKGLSIERQPHGWPTSPMPMGGIGPTSCEGESMAILFAGIGFAVLTVMTDGLDLLAAPAFAALGWWGGMASTGWGAWHAIRGCPL